MVELSAYEAKRRRRVDENRAALLSLQIERLPAPKRPRREVSSTKNAQPVERRRSARLRELKTITSEGRERARRIEKRERLSSSNSIAPVGPRVNVVVPAASLDLPVLDLSSAVGVGPRVSTRELDVRVERFHEHWLGKQILPLGKTPVMQGIVGAGVAIQKKPIAVFGRMSGVQQFRNALALFVNVDQDTSYNNVFQETGADDERVVFFRWFAQKHWRQESSAIQRLLRVRRGDARFFLEEHDEDTTDGTKDEQEEPKDEPLLLFLRQTLGPYVYCGRLGFLGMREAAQPFEFRWQLLDADAINWMSIRRQLIDSLVNEDDKCKATQSE